MTEQQGMCDLAIRSPLLAARTEFVRNADGLPDAPDPDSGPSSKGVERDLRVVQDSFEYDQTIPVFRFVIRPVLKTPLERLRYESMFVIHDCIPYSRT